MLFYISPSVADSLENDDGETFDFLCRLIDARRRGWLMVHATESTYDRIGKYFSSAGRKIERDVIASISKRRRETRGLVRDLTRLIFVSSYVKRNRLFRDKLILTSPALLNNTNFLHFPIVLGENLDDCELYFSAIAENYNRELPASMKGIKLAARKQLGGGHTTHTQYNYYKLTGQDLCLCIVDSDRKCPDDGLGETAKLIVESDEQDKIANCDHVVIDMYSAENLLREKELRAEYIKGKNAVQVKNFEKILEIRQRDSWRYLPLKKGIKGRDLKDGKAYAKYWKTELTSIGIQVKCCQEELCDCVIVPSLSSKTLSNSIQPQNSGWYSSLNDEANADVRSIYQRISREFRSWFCVGSEIRT